MGKEEILRPQETGIGRKHNFNQGRLKSSLEAERKGKPSKKELRALRRKAQL